LLITAPTGSGKPLAAFLSAIDRLMRGGAGADRPACEAGAGADPGRGRELPSRNRVLYVSPLKALVYDIERNLRAPLVGIARAAEAAGVCADDEADIDLDAPPADLVRARHGSVSQDQRRESEQGLRRGAIKAIVAISSLEIGIDRVEGREITQAAGHKR
jgi:Lhr-like helicase